MENIEREKEAKLQAAAELPVAGSTDKKGAKKDAKEVKKDAKKGGKGGKDAENQLKIGQWTITPNVGTIAPESSMVIEVKFAGNGQKLFEQKIAVDVENRNPNDEPNGILY